jgi:hypothetical protein
MVMAAKSCNAPFKTLNCRAKAMRRSRKGCAHCHGTAWQLSEMSDLDQGWLLTCVLQGMHAL